MKTNACRLEPILAHQGIMELGDCSMSTLADGMLTVAKSCLPDKCRCGGLYRTEVRFGRLVRMCPECRDYESYSGLALSFAHDRARRMFQLW
jgi:hypothetical protein